MNDNDLISRRTLQDGISSFKMPWDYVNAINSIASISTLINEAPAVEAAPVVHARWKNNGNGTISCSRCSTWFQEEYKPYLLWCGYCGAKMDGDTERLCKDMVMQPQPEMFKHIAL